MVSESVHLKYLISGEVEEGWREGGGIKKINYNRRHLRAHHFFSRSASYLSPERADYDDIKNNEEG